MEQYLKIDILYAIVALFLMIPLWNGFLIRYDKASGDKKKRWSNLWHFFGVLIRGVLCFILARLTAPKWEFLTIWQTFAILGFCCYPVWNWMVNWGMKIDPPKILFYIGGTAWSDKINNRIIYGIYVILFINLVLSFIL